MDRRSTGDTGDPTPGGMHRRSSIHLALAGCLASTLRPARADAEQPVQQITDVKGLTAEIIQCHRKAGTLAIVLRFKNEGMDRIRFNPLGPPMDYDSYYLIANMRKYSILRDSGNIPIAKNIVTTELDPGEIWNFWARFPAPPPDVKAVELYTPLTLPFEDVAIVD